MNRHDTVIDLVDTVEAIEGDVKVLKDLASRVFDCDECGDPIDIGDLKQMQAFAQSVVELAASALNNIDTLLP